MLKLSSTATAERHLKAFQTFNRQRGKRMTAFILNNLMKFTVPLALFVWSLFQPSIAGYVYITLAAIFVGYLFFTDIAGRPKPDSLLWRPEEARVIRDYHLALRFPSGARDFSCFLNGIRWSGLIWIPWMLWNHLWIPAGFLAAIFICTSSMSVRLDPFFFLGDAARRGQVQFAAELQILQTVYEKMNESKGRVDAPHGSDEAGG